ncbi:YciI family protein [Kitasatospora mediocidica]|uniref:YciI family protein n=1 Tax=Kitasatospora mediocidica TaxID=58352 RepID=UPI000562A7C0|nr:YciI family protein [Kitasatospora mediocidica]
MTKFVVEFEYNVDRDGRQETHPAHAENLYSLADQGIVLLAGPLVGENSGLLVYEVADRDELQKLLDDEPYVKAGLVSRTRVLEWTPGKGSWIKALAGAAQNSEAEGSH